jgi:hypothetical protein
MPLEARNNQQSSPVLHRHPLIKKRATKDFQLFLVSRNRPHTDKQVPTRDLLQMVNRQHSPEPGILHLLEGID